MSYSNAAAAYRERDILTASPAQLVVLVYDHALSNLMRARTAHEKGLEPQCFEALNKARETIMELVITLDDERGGDIAKNLRSLYTFILTELVDAGVRFDAVRLDRITTIVSELRGAFATIVADATRASAA